jgi:NTP pyrophosphatase (non-canonical NTP hydrolase)
MASVPTQLKLADLQQFIAAFCRERGWDKRTSPELVMLLTEEVGEVAKGVRKELNMGAQKPETTDHLAEELVDVLNYILDIANRFDIDLEQAFRAKWAKNFGRTWPESSK